MPLTAASIANQVLRHLGDEKILGLDDTERRAVIINEYYETARDYVLEEHPWNFALKRARLSAYTTPSASLSLSAVTGGGVVVDATGDVFDEDTDVGKTIRGSSAGVGTITAVNSASQVLMDVTSDFASTSVASGAWTLYNAAPDFGYDYSLSLPSDWLRGWRLSEDDDPSTTWQREGDFILANSATLDFRYIARIEDVGKFSMHFVRCLVAYLTTTIAEGITGQGSKQQYWMQVYQAEMRRARTIDGQEGAPERLRSDTLVDARFGG